MPRRGGVLVAVPDFNRVGGLDQAENRQKLQMRSYYGNQLPGTSANRLLTTERVEHLPEEKRSTLRVVVPVRHRTGTGGSVRQQSRKKLETIWRWPGEGNGSGPTGGTFSLQRGVHKPVRGPACKIGQLKGEVARKKTWGGPRH